MKVELEIPKEIVDEMGLEGLEDFLRKHFEAENLRKSALLLQDSLQQLQTDFWDDIALARKQAWIERGHEWTK
jgi:hypothetical protein